MAFDGVRPFDEGRAWEAALTPFGMKPPPWDWQYELLTPTGKFWARNMSAIVPFWEQGGKACQELVGGHWDIGSITWEWDPDLGARIDYTESDQIRFNRWNHYSQSSDNSVMATLFYSTGSPDFSTIIGYVDGTNDYKLLRNNSSGEVRWQKDYLSNNRLETSSGLKTTSPAHWHVGILKTTGSFYRRYAQDGSIAASRSDGGTGTAFVRNDDFIACGEAGKYYFSFYNHTSWSDTEFADFAEVWTEVLKPDPSLLPRPTLIQVGGADFTLTASQGTYSISGQDSSLLASRLLTGAQGSYTVSGQTVNLLAGRKVTAAQGSYTISGQDANLLRNFLLSAGQGTYSISGQDSNFLRGYHIDAGQGTYTISGKPADLIYSEEVIEEIKRYTGFIGTNTGRLLKR